MGNERVQQLRAVLIEQQLDALVVTQPENRRYLSGFRGSAGVLILTQTAAICVADGRYWNRVEAEAPDFSLRKAPIGAALEPTVAEVLRELAPARIAYEAQHVTVAQFQDLQRWLEGTAIELLPSSGLLDRLRERKDPAELAILRRAIAITDAALAAVQPALTPELTERAAAWRIEMALRDHGADGPAFPIIVAAGPNGANAHAQPGDEPLGSGRPIVIDMGARLDGYHADMTRTLILGQPDARFREIYTLVLEAQQRAIGGLRAGVSGSFADGLARDYLAAAGYAEYFTHSLGHGVGLAIHEGPRLRALNEQPLPAAAVVSVEPGLYLPGWGGVRIEDLVLLHEHGCEVLTAAPK